MSKRKHNWNSYEFPDKFLSGGPSCGYYNNKYPNYKQNEDHNTSANITQDLVKRSDLHRNPETFRDNQHKPGGFQIESKYRNNWTDRYWLKQSDIPTSTQTSESRPVNFKKPKNNIEKTLNEMFAQPAEMSKGKSLLEKMGWKGGGLGKDENGIVDPIVPKATYATRTIGLGLLAEEENDYRQNNDYSRGEKRERNRINKFKKRAREEREFEPNEFQFKQYFRTNVLLRILQFVKNNTKIELRFDEKLTRLERKIIHHLVEYVQECDNAEFSDFHKGRDKEIVDQIKLYNNYVLNTESNGKGAKRRLCLYKEAPDNVYSITPVDLREDNEEKKTNIKKASTIDNCNKVTDTSNEKKNTKSNENKLEINDVQMRSVDDSEKGSCDVSKPENGGVGLKLNIVSDVNINNETDIDTNNKQEAGRVIEEKKERREEEDNKKSKIEDKEKESCLKKIIDYFKEFADHSIYKEFRFLGDFNNDENDAIKLFFDICQKKPIEVEEKSKLMKILSREVCTFNVDEDRNGSLLSRGKVLRLFDVVEELGHIEDDEDIPSSIVILPSENSNSEITDENSDDEIEILSNLSGSQLRSPATLSYRDDDDDNQSSNDSKDDVLDAVQLAKRSHIFVRHANKSCSFIIDNFPHENKDVHMVPERCSHIGYRYILYIGKTYVYNIQALLYYFNSYFDNEFVRLCVKYYYSVYATQ